MLLRSFAALLLAGLLPSTAALAQDAPAPSPTYSLRAGDHVTIELYTSAGVEITVVGGARTIDSNGEVFLPFVGTVSVLGMDQSALREDLTRRYSEFYTSPVVDVRVELGISVTGAVQIQGQYFVDPTATIVQALAKAGGMAAEVAVNSLVLPADQRRVRLVRDGRTHILNLRPGEVTNETLQMLIQSGDWIHVPPRARSEIRDQITFWGGVLSFVTNIVALIILANR